MADTESRAGLRYGSAEVLAFTDRVHAAHDAALEAAFDAPAEHGFPSIQLGPAEGRFLELLTSMIQARRAIEIGTLAGYSAIRIARGLAPGGMLWTIEQDAGRAEVARARIAAAGFGDRVDVIVGAAVGELPALERLGPFDLVFLDADKERYDIYGRWAHAHLRVGGVLVADNAYLFGRLMEQSAEAAAVRRFHSQTADRFRSACIPTPDGLLVGIK